MDQKEINALLATTAEKRYKYFVKKVSDFESIWGLYAEGTGWATVQNDKSQKAIPFWPKKEFAQLMISKEWKEYVPKEISLNNFIENWIPGMVKDKLNSVVFMTNKDIGILVDPHKLQHDLLEELENY